LRRRRASGEEEGERGRRERKEGVEFSCLFCNLPPPHPLFSQPLYFRAILNALRMRPALWKWRAESGERGREKERERREGNEDRGRGLIFFHYLEN